MEKLFWKIICYYIAQPSWGNQDFDVLWTPKQSSYQIESWPLLEPPGKDFVQMALVWSCSLMMENDVFHALEHTLLYYILESLQMWGKLLLTRTNNPPKEWKRNVQNM